MRRPGFNRFSSEMKVTHNWLKRYVDCDSTPDELAEQLTMIGLEVEGAENVSGGFDGIVVAEVLSKEPHPGADREQAEGDAQRLHTPSVVPAAERHTVVS